MNRRRFAFAAVSLLAAIGLIRAIGYAANEVPLKGKWPKQPFQPTSIFDDNLELSVKDGRIHIRCGDEIDGEVKRITYDKASDILTLDDIALIPASKTDRSGVRVRVIVHRTDPIREFNANYRKHGQGGGKGTGCEWH